MIKQSYLRTLVSSENFYVLTPKKLEGEQMIMLMRSFGALQEVLGGSIYDNPEYKAVIPAKKAEKLIRTLYTELHEIVKPLTQGNYDAVEVPETFLVARNSQRLSPDLLKTTMSVRDGYSSGRQRVTLKNLQKHNGRIYYGFNEDASDLSNAGSIFRELTSRDKLCHTYSLGRKESKGTAFISISKGNEKYMKMLGRKAIHVDYFYQTFLTRKIDAVIQSRLNSKISNKFDAVFDLFHHTNFKHVNENVYNKTIKVRNYIREHRTGVDSHYICNVRLKNKLGIDIDNIDNKFKMQKELDELILLSEKNRNRLKWFDLPYEIDIVRDDHKELVDMLVLMFEG